ncbi:hypothetical protein L1887_49905 [Cichorium endivia]|nr:hypothetical protein L1887_49905 [Cichorium endivia]
MDTAILDKREGQVTVDTTRTSLNGFGVFAIIVFACVSLIVIRPLKIRIPQPLAHPLRRIGTKVWLALAGPPDASEDSRDDERTVEQQLGSSCKPMYITVDHVSAPVIGVAGAAGPPRPSAANRCARASWAKTASSRTTCWRSSSRSPTSPSRSTQPAYSATSPSSSASKQAATAAKPRARPLSLALLFLLVCRPCSSETTPSILSGTAFLVYFTRVAGISPPDAWIWAEFVAANVSSAVLVSSNPTNLVIATGFDVNFITYTAYMVLPAFGSAVGGLAAMLVFFRNRDAPKHEPSPDADQKSSLRKLVESVPGMRSQSAQRRGRGDAS